MTATHRISGPASLIGAVPHLIGFTPTDSLVLIFLHDGQLACTARLDLDGLTDDIIGETVATITRQVGTVQIIAIVYTDDSRNAPTLPMPVMDYLSVHDGRYYSLTCEDESACGCPTGGRPIDEASPFNVQRIVDGSSPLRTRELLADAARPRYVRPGSVDLCQSIATIGERDTFWYTIDAMTDPVDLLREHDEWLFTATHGGVHAAPAYFLAAWAAFRAGDGASANVAVEHCLVLDPGYSAAKLLVTALTRGVNGSKLPRLTH